MTHTPGPWIEFHSVGATWIGNCDTGEIVCDRPHFEYESDKSDLRWRVNKPLLLAAPDLLAALEEFIACGPNAGHNQDLLSQVHAAIAKATQGRHT